MAERTKFRKYQGGVSFGQSFEIQSGSPIDDRLVVNTIQDLTDPEVWKGNDGGCYTYKGMIVSVATGTSAGEVYVFKGESGNTAASNEAGYSGSVCNSLNWVKLASNSGSTISLTSSSGNSNDAYSKRYTLTQGETNIGTIDIPKDMVVDSGSIVNIIKNTTDNKYYEDTDSTYDNEITGVTEGKYIKLVLANSTSILYIAVNDLVDVYTTPDYNTEHTTDIVKIAIDGNNEITGSIKDNSITSTQLHTDINSIISNAVTGYSNTNGSFISLSKDGHNLSASIDVATIQLYTEEEANTYNETLEGHVSEGQSKPGEGGGTYTAEEAAAYNATLEGAVAKGDLKQNGLVTAEGLVDYVSGAIAGADNALYYITKSGNYINVTAKGTDDNNPDTIDIHHQQISLTFGNATGLYDSNSTANQGIVDTALLREALTWE